MDSVSKIVSAMQAAARICEQPKPSFDAARNIIGLSLDVAVERLFPDATQAVQKSVFNHYKDQYTNHDQTPSPMFDGAVELLTSLNGQGYKLAVATGKGRNGLNRVMNKSKTDHLFHCSRSSTEAESKPSPDMLNQILTELGLEAHEAVMIGDTVYDLAMAKAIGMDSIGVSFGVHNAQQLKGQEPLAVVDSLVEVRGLV